MGVGTFVKVSGVWQRVTRLYGKVSGTWQEADSGYAKASGTYQLVHVAYAASGYTLKSSGSGSISVPSQANAIHFQYGVGGGGGATGGIDYDKAGGESSGAAGGSGAYVSDVIYSVTGGSSYSYSIGSGGAAGNQTANFKHPRIGSAGTTTSVSGLFSLSAGGGGSLTGGGVQGPLASGSGGSAGTFSNSGTRITSGQYLDSSYNVQTIGSTSDLTGGPRGTFNQAANGTAGGWNGNCSGDNCRIGGTTGASSYAGAVSGGSGGSSSGSGTAGGAGSRGSGGGGGAAQVSPGSTNGGAGGNGEIRYRFLYVF